MEGLIGKLMYLLYKIRRHLQQFSFQPLDEYNKTTLSAFSFRSAINGQK